MKEEFPGQKKKEKLVKTLRKNPAVLWKKSLKFTILFILSIFVMTYLSRLEVLKPISNYINIAGLIILLASLTYGFYIWALWYYDVYVVTSERIVEVRQKGLFHREVKEVDLSKIQDITYSVSGFLSTVMEIGNVNVSAATGTKIEMADVSKPSVVREVILKLAEKAGKGKDKAPVDELAEALAKKIREN